MGESAIPDFILFLENNGIFVCRCNLEAEKLDAFSKFSNEKDKAVVFLTADKNSSVRSRLDVAHELAHLLLHSKVRKDDFLGKNYKLYEDQAFYFASAFLLPSNTFVREIWSPSLDAFRSLKQRWRVSIGAMIKRSEELGLLNEEQTKRMWINYNRRGWRQVEPFDDEIPFETSRLIRRSFDLLVTQGIKTKEEILFNLPYSAYDIQQLSGLPESYFDNDFGQITAFPKIKTESKTISDQSESEGKVLKFPISAKF